MNRACQRGSSQIAAQRAGSQILQRFFSLRGTRSLFRTRHRTVLSSAALSRFEERYILVGFRTQLDIQYNITIAGFPIAKQEFPSQHNQPSNRVIALQESFPSQVAPISSFMLTILSFLGCLLA